MIDASHEDERITQERTRIDPLRDRARRAARPRAFQTLRSRDATDSTGIGLAIVRRIVDAHGGRAWSSPNRALP